MSGNQSLLIVDDEPGMRAALQANFQREGWNVHIAIGHRDALRILDGTQLPLVITDVRMPDGDGLDLMRKVRQIHPATAVVVLTAFGTVRDAVRAMRDGACDYLTKPVRFEDLRATADKVMQSAIAKNTGEVGPRAIVGSSPVLLEAIARARNAASANADVLIAAESGTGKELLARFIHENSHRREKPFVAVNCAAIPETLLESELFGHARGAFTGATSSKPGKFELANGGTLLLDEIGDMPIGLQPKLLRALQERQIERLGDTRSIPVDIRIIATTNISLQERVAAGVFRADLYYRLNVIPLTLPPLRNRCEDIPALTQFFCEMYAREAGKPAPKLDPTFVSALTCRSWPGNVRELANLMRRAVVLNNSGIVGPEEIGNDVRGLDGRRVEPLLAKPKGATGSSIREIERRVLESTLEVTNGNRTHAAELLGISVRTIRNKIREYGLPPRRYA